MDFTPQQAILELGDAFYDPVAAAPFPQAILRFRNDRAAAEVGLDGMSDAEWIAHFGRFEPLRDSLATPLALRYHGHQFRVYNPEIGDGRGFLFAQMRDRGGRLMDLGTKGSGQTPHSRFGDGRLTLKGGVREILATEMLEALGVETSRSFSLIETGEALHRGDEPSPTRSSVLVRLSHGHIRIGTFQRLAHLQDRDALRQLTAYVLRHYHGEEYGEDGPARLLAHVTRRTARMAARYMAAGFVHGVLNSDNINVTGESFDYGPWRFAPFWDPGFTAAYFDHAGLYAFGRQPEAIYWDAMQLAISLRPIAEEEPLIEAMDLFPEAYRREVTDALLWRLGVLPRGTEADRVLTATLEKALAETLTPLDEFFFDAFGGELPTQYGEAFDDLRGQLEHYRPRKGRDHDHWSGAPCSMLIDEVEAIWASIADSDDWGPLHAKVAAIRRMAQALA
ncbi:MULTISPECIES: protein adenylyltransferase SelO family protein [unclassified Sphingomonas]|uniref:protein adenylyltransferase SelO family protein n=1 Tax=Sphingomonas TaxID=13687 RepID=UPI00095CB0C6|nr:MULTISPECIES: YdiU family protein [unclassified Sphingomonas]MBN8813089.1 YdiU family protein [Sphingomonas sp.]OJY54188.1 MAG: selenoprotein O [Sphingomonas sp. 67-41]